MRRMAVLMALALACAGGPSAYGQETPHVEIFAGGMYFDANTNGSGSAVQNNVSLRGWNFSVSENINHWFGGAIDVSGAYANPRGIREFQHTIVGGPVFSYRKISGVTPFAHAMIGGGRGRQRNTRVGQEREHDQVVGALVPGAAHLVHAGQRQVADGAAGLLEGLPAGRVGKGFPELDSPAGK